MHASRYNIEDIFNNTDFEEKHRLILCAHKKL